MPLSDESRRWLRDATPAFESLLQRIHDISRTKDWEATLWCHLLNWLPVLPSSKVADDLIDRRINLVELGHCNWQEDRILWRLAEEVDEALLTLAIRRFASPEYTTGEFEEVLYAHPSNVWNLRSLAIAHPSDPHKQRTLIEYIRRHEDGADIARWACEKSPNFAAAWESS